MSRIAEAALTELAESSTSSVQHDRQSLARPASLTTSSNLRKCRRRRQQRVWSADGRPGGATRAGRHAHVRISGRQDLSHLEHTRVSVNPSSRQPVADGAASGVAAISSSSSSVTLCSRVERTSRGAMSVTPVIGCLHPSPACDHLRRPLQHFPSCPQLLGYPPAARRRCAGNICNFSPTHS